MTFGVKHVKSDIFADFTGTVTVNNSSGGTATTLATDLVRPSDWNSGHIFTPDDFFEPFPLPNTNSTLSAPGIGTWYLNPIFVPGGLNSGRLNVFISNAAGFLNGAVYSAASSGSNTLTQTLHHRLALYKLGTGASTSRLETVWTGSCDMIFTWMRRVSGSTTSNLTVSNFITASFPAQFDASGGVTYSTTSQSGSTSVGVSTGASTLANNLITGVIAYVSGARNDAIPFATSVPPGVYWVAHMFSSSSASAGTNYTAGTMMSTQSRLGLLGNNMQAYRALGQSISNSSSQPALYEGFLATTTSAASSVIGTSDVRGTSGRLYFNAQR